MFKKKLYSPERDFIHIDDIIKIIYLIIKKSNLFSKYSVYNIGSGKKTSLEEILIKLEKMLNKKIKLKKKILNSKELNITWSLKEKIERKLSINIKDKLHNIIKSSIKNFKLNDQ